MPSFCPPRPDYVFWIDLVARYRPCRIYLYICRTFAHYLRSICPHSLMDRISDSGSDGCGSIPHEGTKSSVRKIAVFPGRNFVFMPAVRDFAGFPGRESCFNDIVRKLWLILRPPHFGQPPETEPRSGCHTCRTPWSGSCSDTRICWMSRSHHLMIFPPDFCV